MFSDIERIFKNRLKNKKSLEGIDQDELWSGIAGAIESAPSRGTSSVKKWGLLLFLLLLASGAGYIYLSQDHTSTAVEPTQKGAVAANQTEGNSDYDNSPKQSTQASPKSKIEQQIVTKNPAPTGNRTTGKPDNSPKSTNHTVGSSNPAPAPALSDSNVQKEGTKAVATGLFSDKRPSNTSETSADEKAKYFVENISSLPVTYLNIPEAKLTGLSYQPSQHEKEETYKPLLEFSFLSGVNTMRIIPKGGGNLSTFTEQLSKATATNAGISSGFRVAYLMNRQLSVISGIDYEKTQTVFEFTADKTAPVWVPDHLAKYSLDPITGDTINAEYGAMINQRTIHHVLHHNKFTSISIPLELGYRKALGVWTVGINMGASYNFFLSQKGRTINTELDIYDFDDKTTANRPFRKSFFALQLNPYVDLRVNDRFSIRFNPVLKYQNHGMSDLYKTKQSSVLMGLRGGLVVRW